MRVKKKMFYNVSKPAHMFKQKLIKNCGEKAYNCIVKQKKNIIN